MPNCQPAKPTRLRRRTLCGEALESRCLLAGNLIGFAGDWNSAQPDRIDSAGMYDPRSGYFFLRDENSPGYPQAAFVFGPGSVNGKPVAGDWNGDGVDTVGVFVPSTSTFLLATANSWNAATQSVQITGTPAGSIPLAGNWNGDSRDELALYSPAGSQFQMKTGLQSGAVDSIFSFWPDNYDISSFSDLDDPAAWRPVAGNFDGLPGDEVGLLNVAASELFYRQLGDDTPVVRTSVFQPASPQDHVFAGDWDANGMAELGYFNSTDIIFTFRNELAPGTADSTFYVVPTSRTEGLSGGVAHVIGPVHPSFGQPEMEPLPPPPVPADISLPFITETEVKQLLARAAAASSSTDAIIAIVDRSGRILGVRMEQGVLDAIPDEATRLFAIDGAVAKARTAAFFANHQGPLTSRTIRMISQSTVTQREVESNPTLPAPAVNNPFSDADPTSLSYGPGFVAPIGVGGHFPPGIAHTPPVDLFGIERQSRDGKRNAGLDGIKGNADDVLLTTRFNADGSFVPASASGYMTEDGFPESYGVQSGRNPFAQSRGIATLPGGIPLYKKPTGRTTPLLVGGIGVFFPGTTGYATFEQGFRAGVRQTEAARLNAPKVLEAEWIAYAAAGGSSFLRGGSVGTLGGVARVPGYDLLAGRIDLAGITLEVYGPNPTRNNPRQGYQTLLATGRRVGQGSATTGDNQFVDPGPDLSPSTTADNLFVQSGKLVPEGWLVLPHAGGSLTTDDVTDIVTRSIAEADRTRAAIRVNLATGQPGPRTKMVISVADKDGNVLGLYRMPDATVFSIDVAVAKARNMAYYNDSSALMDDDLVDDDLLKSRGSISASELHDVRRITTNQSYFPSVTGVPDLFKDIRSSVLVAAPKEIAFTNRTFRFLAEPRYPAGVDGTLPPIFSTLNDHNLAKTVGVDPRTAENLFGAPIPVSMFQSVLGYTAFHQGRNFRDPDDIENQNGVVFFPGSSPLYKTSILVGGFGISGDGVDQDDVVTFAGQGNLGAPAATKADQVFYRGVRLPYQKFNRNPQG